MCHLVSRRGLSKELQIRPREGACDPGLDDYVPKCRTSRCQRSKVVSVHKICKCQINCDCCLFEDSGACLLSVRHKPCYTPPLRGRVCICRSEWPYYTEKAEGGQSSCSIAQISTSPSKLIRLVPTSTLVCGEFTTVNILDRRPWLAKANAIATEVYTERSVGPSRAQE